MEAVIVREIFAYLICGRSSLRVFEIGSVDHGIIGEDPLNPNTSNLAPNILDFYFRG